MALDLYKAKVTALYFPKPLEFRKFKIAAVLRAAPIEVRKMKVSVVYSDTALVGPAKVSKVTGLSVLFIPVPIEVYKFTGLAVVSQPGSAKVGKALGIVTISPPRARLMQATAVAVLKTLAARLPKVSGLVALRPLDPAARTRAFKASAIIFPKPPARAYAFKAMSVIAAPPPVVKTRKVLGLATVAPKPPSRLYKSNALSALKPLPPSKLYLLNSFAVLMPKPTVAIVYGVRGLAVVSARYIPVYKMTGLAALVPLSSIGPRVSKSATVAVLARPTPSSRPLIMVS